MEERIVIEHLDGERKIFSNRACFKQGEYIGDYVGGGSSGEVNVICLKKEFGHDCNHVVKAINLDDHHVNEDDVAKEISMSKIASELKLGPTFVNTFRCLVEVKEENRTEKGLYQFIVTEKYDTDIGSYLEEAKTQDQILFLKRALLDLMSLSVKYLFYHGDIYETNNGVNEGNIVLKLNAKRNVICAKYIDFDTDCKIGVAPDMVKEQWLNIFQNLRDDHEFFQKYVLDE